MTTSNENMTKIVANWPNEFVYHIWQQYTGTMGQKSFQVYTINTKIELVDKI